MKHTAAELADEEAFARAISPLYSHVYASRYLRRITEEEKKQLLSEAEAVAFSRIREEGCK
jgi:hypothetical protein